jgi:uncharacterized protein YjhX (UPF0386 family)
MGKARQPFKIGDRVTCATSGAGTVITIPITNRDGWIGVKLDNGMLVIKMEKQLKAVQSE